MQTHLLSGIVLAAFLALAGCANTAPSAGTAPVGAPRTGPAAEYVFDPVKGEYYWEKGDQPVVSKYE